MNRLILGLAAFTFATTSYAQVCTPSAGNIYGNSSGLMLPPYDSCTATDQLAVSCSGLNPIGPATDAIWSVEIGPGPHSGSLIVSTTNATYDLYVGLMSGGCSGASPCPLEADSNGPGGSEILGPIDALATGSYYLLVTTFGAGCGPVSIMNPTLPAELTRFSVE